MTHVRILGSTDASATGKGVFSALARSALALVLSCAVAGAGSSPATAAQAAESSPSLGELRASVIKRTDAARSAAGCEPLRTSARLTTAAQDHAEDMAAKKYFSHTSADGRGWDQRIRAAGYEQPAGENIAHGFASPAGVMKGWMASPGHRRNVLDCDFRSIGVGYAADGRYWVQDFGY